MKHFLLCLVLAMLAPLSVASANDCTNNTQMSMNECAAAAYKKTDAELNRVYQQVKGRLTKNQDTTLLLVAAQKRWVGFRDAECAFTSSSGTGGSIYPLLVTQCRDTLSTRRIEELNSYLHCQEGDMSCPLPIE